MSLDTRLSSTDALPPHHQDADLVHVGSIVRVIMSDLDGESGATQAENTALGTMLDGDLMQIMSHPNATLPEVRAAQAELARRYPGFVDTPHQT